MASNSVNCIGALSAIPFEISNQETKKTRLCDCDFFVNQDVTSCPLCEKKVSLIRHASEDSHDQTLIESISLVSQSALGFTPEIEEVNLAVVEEGLEVINSAYDNDLNAARDLIRNGATLNHDERLLIVEASIFYNNIEMFDFFYSNYQVEFSAEENGKFLIKAALALIGKSLPRY